MNVYTVILSEILISSALLGTLAFLNEYLDQKK